jgi:hypothetical protein
MLAQTKPATAWREANSSRDNKNIKASTADGRPMTTRMPEMVETSQQQYYCSINRDANSTTWPPTAQYGHQQLIMDANSTVWTPTTHEFLEKFAWNRRPNMIRQQYFAVLINFSSMGQKKGDKTKGTVE